ncbi:MAG: hypothetical protein JW791_02345 [Nanoarchaeota archaeon]|nr:hypothetical protein [Nanoarchaeota archaeon]
MSEDNKDFKRLTAFRTSLNTVNIANYVPVDKGADYLEVNKLKVSRVRVVGTVVSKTVAEDRSYAFLTIDDSTDTLSLASSKNFNTGETNVELIEKPVIGDIVEVIGRVNEWEGKRKVNCETLKIIKDPNHWLYHKVELLLSGEKVERIEEKKEKGISTGVEAEKAESESEEDMIMRIIKDNDIGKGTNISLIVKQSNLSQKKVEDVLKTLLIDGLIYEPSKHSYKILDV